MSQRMTDEEFDSRAPWCHKGQADRHTQDRIVKEAKRARSEENRLLEENRKQAETIKSLADEVARTGHFPTANTWHADDCLAGIVKHVCSTVCVRRQGLLRLAGRLP